MRLGRHTHDCGKEDPRDGNSRRVRRLDCVVAGLCAAGFFVFAFPVQAGADSGTEFFEKKIRPVLVEHCYSCHAADAKNIRGGFVLDTRDGIRKGGESGPALTAGKPEESLLLDAIRYESFEMPPKGRLPDSVIADFEKWIRMGAPDPRDGPAVNIESAMDIEEGRRFWAFQKPRPTTAPQVHNNAWPESDIDRYILARLESNALEPVGDADRQTLIRRASFALVGLPPSPQEIDQFVEDASPFPTAYAKVVDRLLQSEHFGERWGRHWLDVARFAESSGGGRSLMFKDAYRYRDYVIDAYNNDKPFDQFLREQIAGDLLPHDSPAQHAEQLIAAGFLALGPTNYEQQDKELLRLDVIDEQIDLFGRAFLGLTLGCARCHDHKFDPVPTSDYYALAGIFGSTQSLVPGNVSKYVEQPLPLSQEERAVQDRFQGQRADLDKQLADAKAAMKLGQAAGKIAAGGKQLAPDDRHAQAVQRVRDVIRDLKRKIDAIKKQADEARPVAMSVKDVKKPADGHIHIRGGVRNLGPVVPRNFVTVAMSATAGPPNIPTGQSGRVELARWLASPDNSLTARVYVNRVWRHLFGVGLVATPDNFGNTGQRPTHPELLEALAIGFMEDGWSTKRLIRQIMLSHVYRLSTAHDEQAFAQDDRNELLWRANRRRLDAEVIRDSMLAVSGQLDLTAGGLTIKKLKQYDVSYEFETVRRSVYVPAFRNSMLELFEVFDFANPNLVVGDRNTSTLPTQALFLMNSPFVIEQSRHAAGRLLAENVPDDASRITLAYRRALGRPPTLSEQMMGSQYIENFPADDPATDDRLEAWSSFCHALLSSLDFRYVD